MQEQKPIFTLHFGEDEIQSFAEANFGRELTDVELNRIKEGWYDDDAISDARYEVISSAINMALNENIGWKEIDEEYLKQKTI